jgi:hypothetical protein
LKSNLESLLLAHRGHGVYIKLCNVIGPSRFFVESEEPLNLRQIHVSECLASQHNHSTDTVLKALSMKPIRELIASSDQLTTNPKARTLELIPETRQFF